MKRMKQKRVDEFTKRMKQKMRIIKRTPTITSFNFLDLEDENALILENIEKELEDF